MVFGLNALPLILACGRILALILGALPYPTVFFVLQLDAFSASSVLCLGNAVFFQGFPVGAGNDPYRQNCSVCLQCLARSAIRGTGTPLFDLIRVYCRGLTCRPLYLFTVSQQRGATRRPPNNQLRTWVPAIRQTFVIDELNKAID
jgi:hypothetical protein